MKKNIRSVIREHLAHLFENYPIGAQYDSNAPWNKEDPTYINVKTYSPNYEKGGFDVVMSDENNLFVDYGDAMEMYFKSKPGSFELLSKMFDLSDDINSDSIKYLIGQGFDFTPILDQVLENENTNYENQLLESYLIYKTEILPGAHTPTHTVVDKSDTEEEADIKVKGLEVIDPESIYFFDRDQAVQNKFNLN